MVGNWEIIRDLELTATNTIHPPKRHEKEKMVTWVSGDGKTQKQLDYIIISDNIETWLNYSKTKGTATPNSENQHKILSVEIRVKLSKPHTANLQKHIQFDIKELRGRNQNLQIPEEDENRKIENMTNLTEKEKDDREHNNALWKQKRTTLEQKQDKEFPQLQQNNTRTPIGSTQEEVNRENN